MYDYIAQYEIAKLKKVVAYISSIVYGIQGGTSGIGRISNYINLRTQTAVTLTFATVFVLEDANGDPGIFNYDSGSTATDDGVNVITDAASRRWVRVGAPI